MDSKIKQEVTLPKSMSSSDMVRLKKEQEEKKRQQEQK